MYIKDMLKKGFFLFIMICGYSQGYKDMQHAMHGICPQSTKTIKYVSKCPTTKAAWKKREELKRCAEVKQNCVPMERFVYHCAVNEWRNATLEVCAPLRTIFGHCVEYNVLGKRIQFNRERCTTFQKPCPEHYQSVDVYKYPECFKTIWKYIHYVPAERPPILQAIEVEISQNSGRVINMTEHTSISNNGNRKDIDRLKDEQKDTNWTLVVLISITAPFSIFGMISAVLKFMNRETRKACLECCQCCKCCCAVKKENDIEMEEQAKENKEKDTDDKDETNELLKHENERKSSSDNSSTILGE